MVFCTRKLNNKKYPPKIIRSKNYNHYDPETMRNDIRSIDWKYVYDCTNVNSAVEYFNLSVKAVFDRHAPVVEKKLKGKPCSWITAKTKKTMSRRDQVHRKAKKHGKPEDWQLYKRLRNRVNNKMKRNVNILR